jgi:hypothetical protein
MTYFAENGYLSCLQFGYENGFTWAYWTHPNVVRVVAGCSGAMEGVCGYASMGGHLPCLKFAHEHGCKWNSLFKMLLQK